MENPREMTDTETEGFQAGTRVRVSLVVLVASRKRRNPM